MSAIQTTPFEVERFPYPEHVPIPRADDQKIQQFLEACTCLKNEHKERNEKAWGQPYFFCQLSDCQLGFTNQNASWEEEKVNLLKSVMKINQLQPRFVILCGDMTHAYPDSQDDKYASQVKDYKEIVSKIDTRIPLYCVCGNHDLGERPTPETINQFEKNYDTKQFYSFWVGGVHCIVLNTTLLKNPTGAPDSDLKQKEWIVKELAESNFIHRFVFTHHPWFLYDAVDEFHHLFSIPTHTRAEFLKLFEEKKVTALFAGHYHANALATHKGILMITTGPVGKSLRGDCSGFRIVKVDKDSFDHLYYPLDYRSDSEGKNMK